MAWAAREVKVAAKVASKLRLPPMPSVHDLLRLYRLKARKSLSQNFLLNERLTQRIVNSAGDLEGAHVCEVGPGPGSITRSIIRSSPTKLTVVEKDERFLPTLQMLSEACRGVVDYNIILGDILKTNLESLFPITEKRNWDEKPPKIHLIGNLPFSVSTILIIRWLQAISTHSGAWSFGRTRMTLTFQKEVAQRIVADANTPQRCRLSVMCQNWCSVKYNFEISGKSFIPPPDVDVGVVTLTPLVNPIIDLDFKMIEKFLRTTFNTRQKYGKKSISKLFPPSMRNDLTERLFYEADLDPLIRPYRISNVEFNRLCHIYKAIIEEYPDIANYDYRACKKTIVEEAGNNV